MRAFTTFGRFFALHTGRCVVARAGAWRGAFGHHLSGPGGRAGWHHTETNQDTDWKLQPGYHEVPGCAPEEVLDELAKAADITLAAANTMAWSSTGAITLDVKDRPSGRVY